MANHNFILSIYDGDMDELSYEKLYCSKEEAKRYMARVMYEYMKSCDEDEIESAYITTGRRETEPVYHGLIQCHNFHMYFELLHTKKIPKTVIFVGNLNPLEQALVNEEYIEFEEVAFDLETGNRKTES